CVRCRVYGLRRRLRVRRHGGGAGGRHGDGRRQRIGAANVRGRDGHRSRTGHAVAQGAAPGVAISGRRTDRARGHRAAGARQRTMNTWRQLAGPHWRPFTVLAACILLLAAIDGGQGRFFSAATAYSTLQIFATTSLVTLGLGLTMMIREFDLSVVGIYGMAGCIAVLTGTQYPWLGLGIALAIGLAAGVVQGLIIVRLHLPSVGVTLGGLLVFVGIAYVLTESRSLPYDNLAVALLLNDRIGGIFSIRSVVALVFFAGAAAI